MHVYKRKVADLIFQNKPMNPPLHTTGCAQDPNDLPQEHICTQLRTLPRLFPGTSEAFRERSRAILAGVPIDGSPKEKRVSSR